MLNNLETRELGEQMRSKGDDAAYIYTQDMLSTLSKMKEDAVKASPWVLETLKTVWRWKLQGRCLLMRNPTTKVVPNNSQ